MQALAGLKEAPALHTLVLDLWGSYMGDSSVQALAGLKEAPVLRTFVLALWGSYMGDSGAQAFAGLKEAPTHSVFGWLCCTQHAKSECAVQTWFGGHLVCMLDEIFSLSWGLSEAMLVLFFFQIYIVCMVFVFAATYFRANYMSWLWMCCIVSLTFEGRRHATICAVDYRMHCSTGIVAFKNST